MSQEPGIDYYLVHNYLSPLAPVLSPGNADVAEEKRAVYRGSVQETVQQ